jgi:hypothetical protein
MFLWSLLEKLEQLLESRTNGAMKQSMIEFGRGCAVFILSGRFWTSLSILKEPKPLRPH